MTYNRRRQAVNGATYRRTEREADIETRADGRWQAAGDDALHHLVLLLLRILFHAFRANSRCRRRRRLVIVVIRLRQKSHQRHSLGELLCLRSFCLVRCSCRRIVVDALIRFNC